MNVAAVTLATAYVADAYAVGIVTLAMRPCPVYRATLVYAAVTVYHIVVAYPRKTPGTMPEVDVFHRIVPAFGGGGTMDDDFCYLTHDFVFVFFSFT